MALQYSHTLLLSLLLLLLQSSIQQQLSSSDLQSLADIRRSLRGLRGSTFFSTWDFTPSSSSSPLNPCSSFSGVLCSPDPSDPSTLRVSVLTLGTGLATSPGLAGPFPASIASLTALTELLIHPGRVSGPIPPDLALNCRRLRLISLSNNLISGPIPGSLAALPDLHTLDLAHNLLSGRIPPSLFSSPNLKVLVLASNLLSYALPTDNQLFSSNLIHLDLRDNKLSGPLPPLPATLRYLSVAANQLSGEIAAAFSADLSNLTFLDLSMNGFTGKIPAAIFSLPELTSVLLDRNEFSGPLTLPESVPEFWQVVDLSHNMISGEVPAGLAGAESLFLNSNRMVGPVPEELAARVLDGRMTTLYGQHNFLTGFPGAERGPLPESVALCLSYNCMELPEAAQVGCPASAGTRLPRPREQCPSFGQ